MIANKIRSKVCEQQTKNYHMNLLIHWLALTVTSTVRRSIVYTSVVLKFNTINVYALLY